MSKIAVCNFNCICINSDCIYRHYITFKERKYVANIYKNIPDIKELINENNNEGRKANCIYGQLCRNKDCGFKHRLSPEGRFKIIDEYDLIKLSTEPMRKNKDIKIVENKLKTTNLFLMLEDFVEEIVKVEEVEKEEIKWTDIVKGKGIELKFEKMMNLDTKTNWADYDSD